MEEDKTQIFKGLDLGNHDKSTVLAKPTLGVDSGSLYIMSMRYAKKFGFDNKFPNMVAVIPITPARADVDYRVHVPEGWNGPAHASGKLLDCDGSVIVGDPCYFLKRCRKFFEMNPPERDGRGGLCHQIRTGGDGGFETEIELSWTLPSK